MVGRGPGEGAWRAVGLREGLRPLTLRDRLTAEEGAGRCDDGVTSLLRVVLRHREPLSAIVLVIAVALVVGLRPAIRAFAPGLAVDIAWEHNPGLDPWGHRWARPPTGIHDQPLRPIYSVGPNGIDESIYFDADARYNEWVGQHWARIHERWEANGAEWKEEQVTVVLPISSADGSSTVWSGTQTIRSAVIPPESPEESAASYEALGSLMADLDARVRAGPHGDDIFGPSGWAPSLVRVLARPVEHSLGLLGLVIAWLLGSRPRAPRHRRLPVEVRRVLLMASVPTLGFALIFEKVARVVGLEQMPMPLAVQFDNAVYASAALVAVLMAVAIRGRAAARSTDT